MDDRCVRCTRHLAESPILLDGEIYDVCERCYREIDRRRARRGYAVLELSNHDI